MINPFIKYTYNHFRYFSTSVTPVICLLLFVLIMQGSCQSQLAQPATAAKTAVIITKVQPLPVLAERHGKINRMVKISLETTANEQKYEFSIGSARPVRQTLKAGVHTIDCWAPTVEQPTEMQCLIVANHQTLVHKILPLKPVRRWKIYLQCHSHVDIGYTALQTVCEHEHWQFFEQAIAEARRTENYPPEAQFKWNIESLWPVESYLAQATPEKRQAFVEAVQKGWIHLEALYANMLTALCRPEELIHVLDCAEKLKREYGFEINSAMVTDVPGQTWGLVPVLAQGGVKYLSLGPNASIRIGQTRLGQDQRPFWWVSPSGKYKVLCWQTGNAYHPEFENEKELWQFMERLEGKYAKYPYDMICIRHCLGDNDYPDLTISDLVKKWNSEYISPKLIITTTSAMMADLEQRYGDQIPAAAGDFTPYWEDGAGSSARETAMNRATAERLVQGQTLWTLLNPNPFPDNDFYNAWQQTLLYSEHTWGARSYVRKRAFHPGSDEYKAQWKIKQAFALDADSQSRQLMNEALSTVQNHPNRVDAIDVFNTTSWPRSELVILPKAWTLAGDIVKTADGQTTPSQRLSTGQLAFLATDVPGLGSKQYSFYAGTAVVTGQANADNHSISNDRLSIQLDPKTGTIAKAVWKSQNIELVDNKKGPGWNEYIYVSSENPDDAQYANNVKITVLDKGPLVATVQIDSAAPGCRHLTRQIRLVDGSDRIQISNLLDKEEIPVDELLKIPPREEGVYFKYPFAVPDGVVRMETPWAVVELEKDQLPGACRDWYTVQRWVDISNQDYGLAWSPVDAPLVEFGKIADQSMSTLHIKQTGTFYSYIMNNYWPTNYQHAQGGKITFRYAVLPHYRFDSVELTRFGIEQSQPLIVTAASQKNPNRDSWLTVEPDSVLVTDLQPTRDNQGVIVRLFNAGGYPTTAKLAGKTITSNSVRRSNFDETPLQPLPDASIDLLPYEFTTLRISR